MRFIWPATADGQKSKEVEVDIDMTSSMLFMENILLVMYDKSEVND